MMKIYVISLVQSESRRAHIDKQFRKQNLNYRFFDALDGKAGHKISFDTFDPTQFVLRTGRAATPGEIGCFASHRQLWRHCITINEPILILEDDINLADDFAAAVFEADVLISHYGYLRLQTEARGKSIRHIDSGSFSVNYYTKVPQGAAAYCISPRSARAFHVASRILTAPVDVFVRSVWEHQQPLFGLQPYTVHPSSMAAMTTITGRRKLRKDVHLRSARLVEKARELSRRALFNRSAIPRS
jgi:glycosyl transferase family 25